MSRKKKAIPEVVVGASEVLEGDVIVLDGGNRARVVSVGSLTHTVTQEVPVKVVSYELLDGDWQGARSNTSMLGHEELTIEERPEDQKSVLWHVRNWFRF